MKNYTTASGNGCIQWNTIFVRFLWGYGDVGSYGPSLFLIKACLWGPLSRQKDNHLPRVLTSLCFCLGLNRKATSIVVWSTSKKPSTVVSLDSDTSLISFMGRPALPPSSQPVWKQINWLLHVTIKTTKVSFPIKRSNQTWQIWNYYMVCYQQVFN